MGLKPEDVRVVVGDVGGGFGMKTGAYPEDLAMAYAARRVQRPLKWRAERLEEFLRLAPKTLRWAIEVRDRRWLCDEIFDVLGRHRTPLVFHDLIERHPRLVTGDFVYLRFHGVNYGGHYSPQSLAAEADRIVAYLDGGLDVYAYFNNDREAAAIEDARRLRRFVEARRNRSVATSSPLHP